MDKLLIIGVIAVLVVFVWQLSNILTAVTNFLKVKHELKQPTDAGN